MYSLLDNEWRIGLWIVGVVVVFELCEVVFVCAGL